MHGIAYGRNIELQFIPKTSSRAQKYAENRQGRQSYKHTLKTCIKGILTLIFSVLKDSRIVWPSSKILHLFLICDCNTFCVSIAHHRQFEIQKRKKNAFLRDRQENSQKREADVKTKLSVITCKIDLYSRQRLLTRD